MSHNLQILLVHPGTQHSHSLAIELENAGVLSRFVTGVAFSEKSVVSRLSNGLRRTYSVPWSNRMLERVPPSKIHTFPALELRALWRIRCGGFPETVLYERNAAFQKSIPDRWIQEATHVVGFDTSSWDIAKRSRALGRPFILVQTIGHPTAKEKIYQNVRHDYPDWRDTAPQKPNEYLQRELAEHRDAVMIVAPSSFVRQTLVDNGVPEDKIRVINFGVDLKLFQPASCNPPKPIVFLFAGALSARKGVPVLLDAWRLAVLGSQAELWLAGAGQLPQSTSLPGGVRLLGNLSHSQLASAMRGAHCFVFPSMFEGLAKVQLEALAAGLPLIGTTASGASDLVSPGETGFVTTPGDVVQLSECLRQIAEDNDLRQKMRERCISTRDTLSWRCFGNQWLALLEEIASARDLKPNQNLRVANQQLNVKQQPGKALLAHPGTQYSFHLARELYGRNSLHRFYTGIGISDASILAKFGSPFIRQLRLERQWQNRLIPDVPASRIRTYPLLEVKKMLPRSVRISDRQRIRTRNESFQRLIPQRDIDNCDIVIGFDTSSQILAQRAKEQGKAFILDRSIGHPRFYKRVNTTIAESYPDWAREEESKTEIEMQLEDQEHLLADVIVVPSHFVANTLIEFGVPEKKVIVNRFGTDLRLFPFVSRVKQHDRLVFLFVGALLARKGLPVLLEAWRELDPINAELWIVGGGRVPVKIKGDLPQTVKWLGRLSREQLSKMYQEADVFVLPSYFEGLAQVLIEAAATGLPIITTMESGGDEVVEHGETGFLVEPGNVEDLKATIFRFLDQRNLSRDMNERLKDGVGNLAWSAYGDRWQTILNDRF